MWYLVRASESRAQRAVQTAIYGPMPGRASLEEAKVTQESALYL